MFSHTLGEKDALWNHVFGQLEFSGRKLTLGVKFKTITHRGGACERQKVKDCNNSHSCNPRARIRPRLNLGKVAIEIHSIPQCGMQPICRSPKMLISASRQCR